MKKKMSIAVLLFTLVIGLMALTKSNPKAEKIPSSKSPDASFSNSENNIKLKGNKNKDDAIKLALTYASQKGLKYTKENVVDAKLNTGKGAEGKQILKWAVQLDAPRDKYGICSGNLIEIDANSGELLNLLYH